MSAVCRGYAPRPGSSRICGNCLYPADCHDTVNPMVNDYVQQKLPNQHNFNPVSKSNNIISIHRRASAPLTRAHFPKHPKNPKNDENMKTLKTIKWSPPKSTTQPHNDDDATQQISKKQIRRSSVLDQIHGEIGNKHDMDTTLQPSLKPRNHNDHHHENDEEESDIFSTYLINDFARVANQCRFGLRSNVRLETFLKRIASIHNDFATRLIDVVDSELVRQVTWGDKEHDAMIGVRNAWLQALENTRLWASASKEMAIELEALLGPMHQHNVSSKDTVERIHAQNEKLVKPMSFYEKAVSKTQEKAMKIVNQLEQKCAVDTTKRDKYMRKAKPTIEKYIETIDAANRWTKVFGEEHRTRMLRALERVETRRLIDCLTVLQSYEKSAMKVAQATFKTATNMSIQLDGINAMQQLHLFATQSRDQPRNTIENLFGYEYRLDTVPKEFGINRAFQGPPKLANRHRNPSVNKQKTTTAAAEHVQTRKHHKRATSQILIPNQFNDDGLR